MPYNQFKDNNPHEVYQLVAKLVNIETGKVVRKEEGETGSKEQIKEIIEHLKDTANTNRTDGNVWKFGMKYLGNQNFNDSADEITKIVKAFKNYMNWIYSAEIQLDDRDENSAHFSMHVPSELTREEFEEDVQEFCDDHNCTFELINQTPNAPSPQFFPMNTKLMYPKIKNYEKLKEDPRKYEAALSFWKKNWDMPFNEEDLDDQEDLVLLYNEYVENLTKWKPVELKLHLNQPEPTAEDSVKDSEEGIAKLKKACDEVAEYYNQFHYDATSEESQKYHVKKIVKQLEDKTGLKFSVVAFDNVYGGSDDEGPWYYPTYTLESYEPGDSYRVNLVFSGGYKQRIGFEWIREIKNEIEYTCILPDGKYRIFKNKEEAKKFAKENNCSKIRKGIKGSTGVHFSIPVDPEEEFKDAEDMAMPYHVLAWNLYELMRSMNDERAYMSFIYIWPDGETKEQCKEDFGDKSSYEDLREAAERAYKRYHKYGLFSDDPKVIALAHELDKKLGLEPIEVISRNSFK